MKEDLKTILYMGLGVLSETNDKIKEVKDDLYNKGKELYEKGVIANEELKHNINEAVKDRVTVVNVSSKANKEDILKSFDGLSENDKKELLKALNKKGWNDAGNEEREGKQNN